jgi:hypothetical protein
VPIAKDMDSKDKEIARLKKLVQELKDENDYLKSPLYLSFITDEIQGRYSILLNPPLKDFRTTKAQKAAMFKIDMNEIICVISDNDDAKSKWIYFNRVQTSVEGIRLVSDKLSFTGSLEAFCKKYDNTKIHLCIVSKSTAVNPFYYYLDKNRLKLIKESTTYNSCNNIIISPKFIKDFIDRKAAIENIISFQKNEFHSK